jgi:hypothetical protein
MVQEDPNILTIAKPYPEGPGIGDLESLLGLERCRRRSRSLLLSQSCPEVAAGGPEDGARSDHFRVQPLLEDRGFLASH